MKKVSGVTYELISKASRQIQHTTVHLIRAQSSFLVKESLDNALKEIKETQKMLESAITHHHRLHSP